MKFLEVNIGKKKLPLDLAMVPIYGNPTQTTREKED